MQFCALNESRGVAAMEEPSASTEASPMRDVPSDVKCGIHECSCGSNRDTSLSMPVCFLVKEQAKSQVAIQELQRRLNQVEVVQDDVIDAIIEFRNYLSDSKSYSFANHVTPSSLRGARSSVDIFSNLTPGSKFSECIVPSVVEVPPILKTRTYSSRNCDQVFNEISKIQTTISREEHSQKQLDLIKNKELVLESDKQDSGLDSDCREHDIHPSINRNCRVLDPESSDELLQLLDEISHRSEILQKQLAVAEEAAPVDDTKATTDMPLASEMTKDDCSREILQGSGDAVPSQSRNYSILQEGESQKVPTMESSFGKAGMMETKSMSRMSAKKRIANSIDSATVSSILKETNVVDLQRQALIYLVDNAVLNTRLKEVEQRLSSQRVESEKLESSLKEEARLLMIENRELRLSLDEQRLESSGMKSRMVMLERVLQSVTHENQELSWQLGESLNLQTLPKRDMHNLSASYGYDGSSFKMPRRASMPSRFVQSEGPKIKLPTHSSSNMDITMEEPDGQVPYRLNGSFRNRSGTILSSTPMVPFHKQKAFKTGINGGFPNDGSPANFHSAKKCFKPYLSQDASRIQKSDKFLEDSPYRSGQDTRAKTVNFSRGNAEEGLDNAGKFPFNSILEKLKSNSEFRLAKSASAKINVSDSHTSSKDLALQESESPSQSKDCPGLGTNSDHVLQKKKGRNIQQRIQNILDRIVAESEEAS